MTASSDHPVAANAGAARYHDPVVLMRILDPGAWNEPLENWIASCGHYGAVAKWNGLSVVVACAQCGRVRSVIKPTRETYPATWCEAVEAEMRDRASQAEREVMLVAEGERARIMAQAAVQIEADAMVAAARADSAAAIRAREQVQYEKELRLLREQEGLTEESSSSMLAAMLQQNQLLSAMIAQLTARSAVPADATYAQDGP